MNTDSIFIDLSISLIFVTKDPIALYNSPICWKNVPNFKNFINVFLQDTEKNTLFV